ncbi:DoxX family protein [Flammeovirgaceae bacterium 311]|nr:DoxX family protein [Flammeovirgaceae bacterium 311]
METKYSYFFLRLPLAMSMFGHGLVRLPKLSGFAEGMTEQFKDSILPEILVLPFGYALPFIELIIGILLILGWQTRNSIYAGLLTMAALVFGSSTIESWGAISVQLIHALYFGMLLHFLPKDRFSIDAKLRTDSQTDAIQNYPLRPKTRTLG